MKILPVLVSTEKEQIVSSLLQTLPEWFGIPESIVEYSINARTCQVFAADEDDLTLGFIALKQHFPKSAEIYVMAVLKEHHRRGVGTALLKAALSWCQQQGTKYLQVKTLACAHPDKHYALTRLFYETVGFQPLETFPLLWGDANPCLQLIGSVNDLLGGIT